MRDHRKGLCLIPVEDGIFQVNQSQPGKVLTDLYPLVNVYITNGTSPLIVEKSTINGNFQQLIAILSYQMV